MDRLYKAMTRWYEASAAYDKAYSECEGSWGYFGDEYIQEREDAAAEFQAALDEVIDKRVQAVLIEIKEKMEAQNESRIDSTRH